MNEQVSFTLHEGADMNTPDRLTFYGGGDKGYTDYPVLG
jgi:N-ethylmaleimide reductase